MILDGEVDKYPEAAFNLVGSIDEAIEKRTKDGLILTGEAGGFVIPFLGEGMPEAFFTGIYAAEAAAKAIKENNFLGVYRTSAKTGKGVTDAFLKILKLLHIQHKNNN